MSYNSHKNNNLSTFPASRPRRLRHSPWIRDIVRETKLTPHDLIWPLFIIEGEGVKEDISSMPGVNRLSIDLAVKAAQEASDLGIPALALFPNTPTEKRTADGAESFNPDNLICRAIKEIKSKVPQIGIIADIALDPYTSHGHDGILEDGVILNDPTLDVLAKQALCLAETGADVLAPSDMMDGRIGHIRKHLELNGHTNTLILSYAAKYASHLYGPFRDAVGSGEKLSGDKKTYQMDPANRAEAIKEVSMDIAEGADMVMVKPGTFYLDIIRDVAEISSVPVFAYQVSGEYAMIKMGSENGLFDEGQIIMESLLAFKRAGCSGILTYFARDIAGKL